MTKLGTLLLAVAVAVIGLIALFAGLQAGSQPFALHMAIIALACAGFLIFIGRRARIDRPQG